MTTYKICIVGTIATTTCCRVTVDIQTCKSRHSDSDTEKGSWTKGVEFDSKVSEHFEFEGTTRGFQKTFELTIVEGTVRKGKGIKSRHMHLQEIGDID